mgnify:FL=1
MSDHTPGKVGSFDPTTLLRPTAYDPGMRRPASTTAGAVLVLLRALASALVLVLLSSRFSEVGREIAGNVDGLTPDEVNIGLVALSVLTAALVLADVVLAVFIYRGRNWALVIVMSIAVISITGSFVAWWWQGEEITLGGSASLLSLGLDILVLLALSSRSSAAYARRNQRR